MSPDEYCQQKAAGSGSSFYYSSCSAAGAAARDHRVVRLLPGSDDVVDETLDPQLAATRWPGGVTRWRTWRPENRSTR
jgi:phytoene synthase